MDLTGFVINNYLIGERRSPPGELEVYAGRHQHLERDVTVQVIRVEEESRSLWQEQVAAEARFLARVSHPNVLHVYDIGTEDDGLIYVVTEQIEGRPLDQLLAERDHLDFAHALRITREVARGLAAFHRVGLLTTELDSASVMVTAGPLVGRVGTGLPWIKLLDLGVGCAVGQARDAPLPEGDARRFLAPEVARREPLTPRVDVFSLGVLLQDLLLVGVPGARLVSGSAVERLVSRALAPLPGDRFGDLNALLDALDTAQANWSFGAAIQAHQR